MHNHHERLTEQPEDELHSQLIDAIGSFTDSSLVMKEAKRINQQRFMEVQEKLQAYRETLLDKYVGVEGGKNIRVCGEVSVLRSRDGEWCIDPIEVEELELKTNDVEVPKFNPLLHDSPEKYADLHATIIAKDSQDYCYYIPVDNELAAVAIEDYVA